MVREAMHLWGQELHEKPLYLASQFYCETKTALKRGLMKKIK